MVTIIVGEGWLNNAGKGSGARQPVAINIQ